MIQNLFHKHFRMVSGLSLLPMSQWYAHTENNCDPLDNQSGFDIKRPVFMRRRV